MLKAPTTHPFTEFNIINTVEKLDTYKQLCLWGKAKKEKDFDKRWVSKNEVRNEDLNTMHEKLESLMEATIKPIFMG